MRYLLGGGDEIVPTEACVDEPTEVVGEILILGHALQLQGIISN
jgi:hypothetical protein